MSLVESICRELEAKKQLALVSIVEQSASAPRHAGAAMVVGQRGLIAGTIGGGILEAKAIELGQKVCLSQQAEFLAVELTGKDVAASGMICGGSLRLFAEPVSPDGATKVLFQRLRIAEGMGDDMFSMVPVVSPKHRRLCRTATKTWPLPTELCALVRELLASSGSSMPAVLTDHSGQEFVFEPWPCPWRLVIVGGGHVSYALAKCAAQAGFTICVMDDREEFASKERFPEAALVKVVPEYNDCFGSLKINEKTFILIITRGHLYDQQVLAQALQTEAGYIGMIGSAKKSATVKANLLNEGFSEQDFARVTTPVGLSIGAETPEEIAISIMAQIIAARALARGAARHLDPALAGNMTKH